MKEDMIIQYVEDVLKPFEVEHIELFEERDFDIYVCEMVHGEEYWILFDQQVCGMYRKCGIFNDIENVLALHDEWSNNEKQEL